jgi:hypothetical protein
VTDRPEHDRYYISPTTVERVERECVKTEREPLVVVVGALHPGQVIDVETRLRSVTLRDRPSAV